MYNKDYRNTRYNKDNRNTRYNKDNRNTQKTQGIQGGSRDTGRDTKVTRDAGGNRKERDK